MKHLIARIALKWYHGSSFCFRHGCYDSIGRHCIFCINKAVAKEQAHDEFIRKMRQWL